MKILLVGVFSYGSTDNWKLLALRRLGHTVVTCPYRETPGREHFPIGEPFDLVLVSKGTPLSAEDFTHLATLGRHRLLWWPDPFENWDDAHTAAMRTGDWRCAATSHVVLRKIEHALSDAPHVGEPVTVRSARILEGCDCDGPHPEWVPATIEPALLHFGAPTPRRAEVIGRLRAAGIRVDHLPRPLFGANLQREVLRYAAVLGVNSSPDLYSNRVQTVLAMGGVMLQEDAPRLSNDLRAADTMGLWTWEEGAPIGPHGLIDGAEFVIEQRANLRRHGAAQVFDRYRWERVMERAVAFGTNQP